MYFYSLRMVSLDIRSLHIPTPFPLSTYRDSHRESLAPSSPIFTYLPPIVLLPALIVYVSLSKSFA